MADPYTLELFDDRWEPDRSYLAGTVRFDDARAALRRDAQETSPGRPRSHAVPEGADFEAQRQGGLMAKCPHCDDQRWVCENHPDRPWDLADSPRACKCGGAGMPCELCNNESTGPDDPPEMMPGFRVDIDDKGPRH